SPASGCALAPASGCALAPASGCALAPASGCALAPASGCALARWALPRLLGSPVAAGGGSGPLGAGVL
ncbi:hypothetical protein ACFVYT_14190, partial [Streptomyces sp. NPDC058290]|uniref:hypothetical protein n=1 Tax=Streptomyces sp. NPDC058290 TaxID=3346426 RepID=UPI0036E82F89